LTSFFPFHRSVGYSGLLPLPRHLTKMSFFCFALFSDVLIFDLSIDLSITFLYEVFKVHAARTSRLCPLPVHASRLFYQPSETSVPLSPLTGGKPGMGFL